MSDELAVGIDDLRFRPSPARGGRCEGCDRCRDHCRCESQREWLLAMESNPYIAGIHGCAHVADEGWCVRYGQCARMLAACPVCSKGGLLP